MMASADGTLSFSRDKKLNQGDTLLLVFRPDEEFLFGTADGTGNY